MVRLGVPICAVLDFSTNISPLGIPASVKAAWPELLPFAGRYPSMDGAGLGRYYETRFGLEPASVLPCNGSAEAIYVALAAFGNRTLAAITPTFSEYARAARASGIALVPLPLSGADGFAPPTERAVCELLSRTEGIVLCNPNNPTGTRFAAEFLRGLALDHPNKRFFIDEAFCSFAENRSELSLLGGASIPENVVVFHSLTKLYALPGLRMGAALGAPEDVVEIAFPGPVGALEDLGVLGDQGGELECW